jgi:hypothetical protein
MNDMISTWPLSFNGRGQGTAARVIRSKFIRSLSAHMRITLRTLMRCNFIFLNRESPSIYSCGRECEGVNGAAREHTHAAV